MSLIFNKLLKFSQKYAFFIDYKRFGGYYRFFSILSKKGYVLLATY